VRTEGTEHIVVADREAIEAVERGEPVPEAIVEDNADDPAVSLTPNPDAPRPERDLLITEDNTFGTELEDALRRDFTINGLFYDPLTGKVIDHVNGLRDLAAEQIRTIGDAEQRMREDPVRILRAVRFAGKLGFDIESRTYAAMEGSIEDLPRCSAPRLLEETFRLIRGGGASPALKLLLALDGLKHLLPPVNDYLAEQDAEGQAAYFKSIAEMDSLVNAARRSMTRCCWRAFCCRSRSMSLSPRRWKARRSRWRRWLLLPRVRCLRSKVLRQSSRRSLLRLRLRRLIVRPPWRRRLSCCSASW
jgi:tRNA nucleotidyltransferase/poly(A) polymerase